MTCSKFKSSFHNIVVTIVLTLVCATSFASECENWLRERQKAKKIRGGDNCLIDCSTLMTDMGTWRCLEQCPQFCQVSMTTKALFNISDLYPGLTAAERTLAVTEPVKIVKAYELSFEAEKLCMSLYFASLTNDESDACRHFVWANLLYRNLGSDLSAQILNAHEQDPKEPIAEKSMDLANNRLGLLTAAELSQRKAQADKDVIVAFKQHLQKGNIVILKDKPTNRRKP